MDYLFIIEVDLKDTPVSPEELDTIAYNQFGCEGRLDYDLNEETVDEILGRDAYCGGDIPESVLERIEENQTEASTVKYFWQEEELAQSFLKYCGEQKIKAQSSKQKQEDWNQTWRESFKEIVVSPNLKVVPSWEKKEDDPNQLFIYPGMGFGTGNHETTFLCLKIYEEIKNQLPEGCECLDFGCGSGILGIAAIKKSRSRVDFVDIDADALDNCVMNLEYNNFQDYSTDHAIVLRERFAVTKTYPLVFANILESVLIEEKELLLSSLAPESHLIVSGLLKDQRDTILSEYTELTCKGVEEKGDWIAIHFVRS